MNGSEEKAGKNAKRESEPSKEIIELLKKTEREELEAKGAHIQKRRKFESESAEDGSAEENSPAEPSPIPNDSGVGEQDELDTDYSNNDEWKPLLAYRRQAIQVKNKQQNMLLRQRIAHTAIRLVIIQIFVSNAFFLIYLLTNLESTDANVMIAWLSSTVVEVIGILLVVARSLFKPTRRSEGGTSGGGE